MAVTNPSPYLDEELRRRFMGPGGVAAPMPGRVAPPMVTPPVPMPGAPPAVSRPRPMPQPSLDPIVADYAARYAEDGERREESPFAEAAAELTAAQADGDGAAKPADRGESAARGTELQRGQLTDGEKAAMWIDAVASGLSGLGQRKGTQREFDAGYWQNVKDRRTQEMAQDRAAGDAAQQKRVAAEEADPGSERSKRAQMAASPMLLQFGLTSDEIGAMSAEQIRKIDPMRLAEMRRGGGPGDSLKDRALKLRERELDMKEQQAIQDEAEREAKKKIDSPETVSAQDIAIAIGMPEDEARKYTAEELEKWRPQVGLAARQLRAQDQWESRFAAQRGERLAQEGRAEERKVEGEEREEGRLQGRRAEDFAKSFAKERETELDIAGLIQDVEDSPGGTPPGFFERFRNAITARGIDPDRMEAWQAKQMILELWARGQTGAAISESEDGRFITQAGMDPAASREQVEAAYKVLTRLTRRRLRGYAASNPEAAQSVAGEYGLNEDWLSGVKAARKQAAPARKPAAQSADDGGEVITAEDLAADDEWGDM